MLTITTSITDSHTHTVTISTDVYTIGELANAGSASIPATLDRAFVEDIRAYFAVVPSEPAHALKFQNGSRWWAIDEPIVTMLMCGGVPDFNPGTGTGTDNAAAWQRFVSYCGITGREGHIPPGHYGGIAAFGTVPDPAAHNVPQIGYETVIIRGAGKDCTFLHANIGPTPNEADWSSVTVTLPMLKAARVDKTGRFELIGVTLDGGIPDVATIGDSLQEGASANVASMLEVRGYGAVVLDVEATQFVQNKDNRLLGQGNVWRVSPVLCWGNRFVSATAVLRGPTFREGFAFGNNDYCSVEFSFFGKADLTSNDYVSSPLLCVSGSSDINVGGRSLRICIKEWSGAWAGSAINAYIPGDIDIDLGGRVLAGGIDTVSHETRPPQTYANGKVFGKGIDVSREIAIGPTNSVTIRNGVLKDCFSYSIGARRESGEEIATLHLDVIIDGGWSGLITDYVTQIYGKIDVTGVIQYVPADPRLGIGLNLSGVQRGTLIASVSGSRTAQFEAPNAPPEWIVAPGTKYSNYGVLIERSQPEFRLLVSTENMYKADLVYNIRGGEHNLYGANFELKSQRNPSAPEIDGPFLRLGTASTRRLKNAFVSQESTYNGAPLLESRSIATHVEGGIYGMKAMVTGNPSTLIAKGDLLGIWEIFSGDTTGSTALNRGRRAAIGAYAADNDGHGAYLSIFTSSGTTPMVERLRVKDTGQVQFVPLAADPAGAANGDVYYNGTTNKLRVYAGGAWVDLH